VLFIFACYVSHDSTAARAVVQGESPDTNGFIVTNFWGFTAASWFAHKLCGQSSSGRDIILIFHQLSPHIMSQFVQAPASHHRVLASLSWQCVWDLWSTKGSGVGCCLRVVIPPILIQNFIWAFRWAPSPITSPFNSNIWVLRQLITFCALKFNCRASVYRIIDTNFSIDIVTININV
jgi:hypothetical protein